jgi:membrane protein involved in colicin uptake
MPDKDIEKDPPADVGKEDPPDTDREPDWKAEVEKWKSLSRKHEGQAKANADAARRLKEAEDAEKSAVDKASERAAEAEKKAAEAESKALRYEVAAAKGIPAKLMRFLPTGTQEELEAAADELLEAIKPADTAGDKGKPKEKLRSGASSAQEQVPGREELLKLIPRQ